MIVKEDNKSKLRLEDWVCVDPLCGNVNYHWRKVCNKCRTSRDEVIPPMVKVIGKNAAEKSSGIFKALDWQCKSCGNVNWAGRQSCNRCYTSKFDAINMLTQDELEDDNMSVTSANSALSALGFPCDSGEKNGRLMRTHIVQWITKIASQFAGVSKEDILAGVVPSDPETIKDTILAFLLGIIATGDVPDSESNELDKLSKEDRIKLLISKCDIPEGVKKILPHFSLTEIKKKLLPKLGDCIMSAARSTSTGNKVPESILTPPITPEQQQEQLSEEVLRRIIMISQTNPQSHHRSSTEKENYYKGINPSSHPQHSQRRSPSPYNKRRSPSPYNNRRARSPNNQRHSPGSYNHRRSHSPRNMRHSPGPYNGRRSPSPHHIRRSPSPHYKRRSPSPHYKRRSQSPHGKRRSQSPHGKRRSQSPYGNKRSLSPYNRHSPSRNGRHSPPHQSSKRHSPSSRHYESGRHTEGPRHYESRDRRERRPEPYRRYNPERATSRRPGYRSTTHQD